MAAAKTQKGRKIGRNLKWCQAYRSRGQREQNKIAKLLQHLGRYGMTDHMAVHFYNNLPMRGKPKDRLTIAPIPTLCKRIPPAQAMPPVRAKA